MGPSDDRGRGGRARESRRPGHGRPDRRRQRLLRRSDNLYPHDLAEFGYLVEGEPVAALLEHYWQPVWTYSAPHCIGRKRSTTFATSAPPVDPRVARRNAQISAESDEIYKL